MPNWWWFDAKKYVLGRLFWHFGIGERELSSMYEDVSSRKPTQQQLRDWVK